MKRYYILRTNDNIEKYTLDDKPTYTFKINSFNAEKFIRDSENEDVSYLLYHIPSKRFIEYGEIQEIKPDESPNVYHAVYGNRHNVNVFYKPYSSPNCGIIPISKKRIDEILGEN